MVLPFGVEESLPLLRVSAKLRGGCAAVDGDGARHDACERGGEVRAVGTGFHARDLIDLTNYHEDIGVAGREWGQC